MEFGVMYVCESGDTPGAGGKGDAWGDQQVILIINHTLLTPP